MFPSLQGADVRSANGRIPFAFASPTVWNSLPEFVNKFTATVDGLTVRDASAEGHTSHSHTISQELGGNI